MEDKDQVNVYLTMGHDNITLVKISVTSFRGSAVAYLTPEEAKKFYNELLEVVAKL